MCHQANLELMQALVISPMTVALAEDVVIEDHAQGRVFQGRREVTAVLQAFFVTGFPDAQARVRTVLADDTTGMIECAFCGHQNGPFLGIPATRREVCLPMVIVCRISDQMFQTMDWYYDAGALLRQLGLAL